MWNTLPVFSVVGIVRLGNIVQEPIATEVRLDILVKRSPRSPSMVTCSLYTTIVLAHNPFIGMADDGEKGVYLPIVPVDEMRWGMKPTRLPRLHSYVKKWY